MEDKQVILITGGTGKIGVKLVEHFLKRNFIVIFTSRNKSKIESMYRKYEIKNLYGIAVDLIENTAILKIIDFLEKNKLFPHSLVNGARNLDYLKLTNGPMPNRSQWIGEYILDVIVPYELSIRLSYWQYSKLKSIVNISSMYGVVAYNYNLYNNPEIETPINYSVAKAGLIHLTKNLSIQLAIKGIRVNSISYGGIEGRVDNEFKKRYAKICPMGRMLKLDEVAGVVEFLVTDMSLGMTGHNLIVDGGWTIW